MLVSRRMVPPSNIVVMVNVTACGLVFWLIIAKIALLVVSDGMWLSVLIMICILILVYSGEYSGFTLVLFLRTLVKP